MIKNIYSTIIPKLNILKTNLLLGLFFLSSFSFQSNYWETLKQVQANNDINPNFFQQEYQNPIFSENIKKLNGQVIELEGYVINLTNEEIQKYFILSRFPYQSCFFCGGAGPETVAEIYCKQKFVGDKIEERIKVKGVLQINFNDPLHLYYMIMDAEVTKL